MHTDSILAFFAGNIKITHFSTFKPLVNQALCHLNVSADRVRVSEVSVFFCKPLFAVFQCDQQSSWTETGGGDADVFTEAHWQHRGHLLCLLHYLWNLRSAGEMREGWA